MNQYPKESSTNRQLAISRGEKIYESKTPCKTCGGIIKYVSSYGCVSCNVKKGVEKLFNKSLMAPYRTKAKANAKTYRYRTRKRNAISKEADHDKILWYYEQAEKLTRETGIQHHVDHIKPLSKGGLHHEDNLQVLTWLENVKKGNKCV